MIQNAMSLSNALGFGSTCYKKLMPILYKLSYMDDLVVSVIQDRFPQTGGQENHFDCLWANRPVSYPVEIKVRWSDKFEYPA